MNPEQLIAAYQLDAVKIRPPQSGYRNVSYPVELKGGEMVNLIVYKSEPGILARIIAANQISNYLAAAGLPTRQTRGRILRLAPRGGGLPRYACLYTYLPGTTIPWEAYTMDHIKLLGLAMSRLHATLASSPLGPTDHQSSARAGATSGQSDHANLGSVVEENKALLERMQRYFAQAGVQSALRAKLVAITPASIPRKRLCRAQSGRQPTRPPAPASRLRTRQHFVRPIGQLPRGVPRAQ
jgi:Ser/Thr protein kinase RdoA (MazF antagonist)